MQPLLFLNYYSCKFLFPRGEVTYIHIGIDKLRFLIDSIALLLQSKFNIYIYIYIDCVDGVVISGDVWIVILFVYSFSVRTTDGMNRAQNMYENLNVVAMLLLLIDRLGLLPWMQLFTPALTYNAKYSTKASEKFIKNHKYVYVIIYTLFG